MKGKRSLSNFSFYFLYQLINMCFQLLVLPLIINASESAEIASYFICLSVSTLLSLFVNFGTNVTSLVEFQKKDTGTSENSETDIYSQSFQLRILPLFISVALCLILFAFTESKMFFLIVLISVLGDFCSPLFFLLYKNDLKSNFQLNLLLKCIVFGVIIVFQSYEHLPQFVLVMQGLSVLILNLILLYQIHISYKLFPSFQLGSALIHKSIEYAPVVGNNLITHLQQSVFLYSMPAFAAPLFIAAYGLIDKIVGSVRMLVNTYNTSYFPQANIEYHKGIEHWRNTRFLQNRISSSIALIFAVVFFLFPELVMQVLMLGGSAKSVDFISKGAELIRAICLVPLVISLNALNVTEVMMAKLYKQHFSAGVIILLLTACTSFLAKYISNESYLGYYPMFIETCTLVIYLLLVYNNRKKLSLIG